MRNTIFKLSILFTIALFTPLSCFADTQETPKESVSQLLQKVKESTGDERRKAMNALKLKLRTVNAATRAKTMQQLHHTFNGTHMQQGTSSMPHTTQTPHRQLQQKTNQQTMTNVPHQNKADTQKPPAQRPGKPSRPHTPPTKGGRR